MPPRKKARAAPANNKNANQVPESVKDLAHARVLLKDWVAEAFSLRHSTETDHKKFPLGGSFLDVVQKCWAEDSTLIEDSMKVLKKLGVISSEMSREDFVKKYMTVQELTDFLNSRYTPET